LGLATELDACHELHHVLLYQVMNYRRIMFGYVMVYVVAHLLLHVSHTDTPCSADDDALHASDHRGQRGRILGKPKGKEIDKSHKL
jgi:hypothetical protein